MKSQLLKKAARWAVKTKESMIKKASGSDYDSARAYYRRKLDRSAEQRGGPPLLVYQMGKVGSKTVIASLRALTRAGGLDMPIHHVHLLQQTLIDEYLEKRRGFLGTEKQGRLEHIWLYEYLREQLDEMIRFRMQHPDAVPDASSGPGPVQAAAHADKAALDRMICRTLRPDPAGKMSRPWKVVTLTRETVGRNISSFFELLEVELLDTAPGAAPDASSGPSDAVHPHGKGPDSGPTRYRVRSDPDFYGFDVEVDTENLNAFLELFLKEQNHDEPVEFFDKEILGVLGVDVYASEFPTSKGYAIYKGELADVLLIRVENLNECASEAFQEFLGIPELPLINENVGSEKSYASLYKAFRQSVVLPASYVERVYATKYMRHFYTEDEIATFTQKWLGPGAGSGRSVRHSIRRDLRPRGGASDVFCPPESR